jgi:hypothetical protein
MDDFPAKPKLREVAKDVIGALDVYGVERNDTETGARLREEFDDLPTDESRAARDEAATALKLFSTSSPIIFVLPSVLQRAAR